MKTVEEIVTDKRDAGIEIVIVDDEVLACESLMAFVKVLLRRGILYSNVPAYYSLARKLPKMPGNQVDLPEDELRERMRRLAIHANP